MTLHTHLIARDDALTLYGFHSERERELFLMLLTVQAVGPKVALAVLSVTPPPELVAALAAGDADRLRAVPGIGKRTAERIIVELREKVAPEAPAARRPGADRGPPRRARADPRTLARAGLLELGYGPEEADELLARRRGRERRGADRPAPCAWRGRAREPMTRRRARIQTPYLVAEDELDRSLRPRRLEEFVGQDGLREQLARGDRGRRRPRRGARPPAAGRARRASARPRWRRSWPPSSRCRSWRPPGRRSSARATSPPS